MLASLDRAAAEEKKHAEKMAKKEAAASAKAKEPPKKVHKIIATRDKNAMSKAKKLAAEEEDPDRYVEQQITVFRDDGRKFNFAAAVQEMHIFLQDHGSEATLEEVHQGTGISLDTPGFLDALRVNPKIESVHLPTGERLKYKHPFGVRNRGALAHVLSRTYPGSGEYEAILRSELIEEETYRGMEADIDELLAQRRCVRVLRTDKAKNMNDHVLFAHPPGAPVIEEVKNMWNAERVPQGSALQEALVKHKLRTKEEMAQRAERKTEAQRRAQEAAAQPKKARVGQVRKWANTHLGDAEKLEELTTRRQA